MCSSDLLDRRAQKCRLVGYTEESGSRIYRVYDEETNQVFITRDVVFDEAKQRELPAESSSTPDLTEEDRTNADIGSQLSTQDPTPKQNPTRTSSSSLSPEAAEKISIGEPLPPIDLDEGMSGVDTYDEDTIVVRNPLHTPSDNPGPERGPNAIPTNRRSYRVHQRREMFGLGAWPAYMAIVEDPITLEEALQSENAVAWKRAWESELDSLRKNRTWVAEKVPKDRNVVGCRWLFQRKEDGRFKVRLVAKGYSQEPGVDFKETFAPVAKFTTLSILLALVAENDWELHSMDVKTAFLNGELEEEVYMEWPEGVHEIAKPGYACCFVKAIYGLRQSPRVWYQKIHTFFSEHDFHRSTQDYSLYINYERKILVLIYVDDLVLAVADAKEIRWIKSALTTAFEMTDLGELAIFLGLEIQRDRSRRILTLGQQRYINRILERHGMLDARPSLTPLDPNTRLRASTTNRTTSTEVQPVNLERYQSAVGSLMYAMLGTRPDLAYGVGLVSQFNHSPQPEHWIAVQRLFRYLVGTKTYTLKFGSSNISGGYSDADWGSGEDRKSVGGFVFLLNGGAISWASKKQTSIALSTTEAEYMGMTQAAKEILWLRTLLDEIGAFKHIAPMSTLNGDNQGAIALARNPEYHARTKHIDIQYHFIRELVSTDTIHLRFCPSTDMIADIMTKALPRPTHDKHTHGMGLSSLPRYGPLREGGC